MFTALTFNMQNGQVWDEANPDAETLDLNQAIAFLQAQNADVLFLQEVERGFDGGRQIEPAPHYLALKQALPEYDSVFAYPLPNSMEIPFGLGLAIFSKTPLKNFFRRDLPPAEIEFEFGGRMRKPSHRLLIGAETEIEGRTVGLLNVHLQAFFMIGASSNEHRAQRDLVEAELRGVRGPALLGGDFNCVPGETLLEQFAGAGFRPVQNAEITWKRMPYVLDHIFYNDSLRLGKHGVVSTPASDHHVVRADFSFA